MQKTVLFLPNLIMMINSNIVWYTMLGHMYYTHSNQKYSRIKVGRGNKVQKIVSSSIKCIMTQMFAFKITLFYF